MQGCTGVAYTHRMQFERSQQIFCKTKVVVVYTTALPVTISFFDRH